MAASPVPHSELQLTVEKTPEKITVHGSGKINMDTSGYLSSTIRAVIPNTKRVVLDLTHIDYIDSSGLGALVSVYVSATRAKCELELANPKPKIADLFKMTRLSNLFSGHGENYFGGM
jgi:anti-sigma B factor antagonist